MRVIFKGKVESDNNITKKDEWLTIGKEYLVLGVYGRESTIKYRLLGDDKTTPAMHNAENFDLTSEKIPSNWLFRVYPEVSEWAFTPSAWAKEGFWMAFFDGDPTARILFNTVVSELETAS